jgi:hypothetical protein
LQGECELLAGLAGSQLRPLHAASIFFIPGRPLKLIPGETTAFVYPITLATAVHYLNSTAAEMTAPAREATDPPPQGAWT